MVRLDYRATLTSQPDFWTKSVNNIVSGVELENATMTFVGPVFQGAMRQQRVAVEFPSPFDEEHGFSRAVKESNAAPRLNRLLKNSALYHCTNGHVGNRRYRACR